MRDEALYGAFLLGWLIVELRSRLQVAYNQCTAPSPVGGFGLQMLSQWRALFSRIADIHYITFPSGTTAQTLFEPPVLPYLHPVNPDYADIGIHTYTGNGAAILGNFGLYEETRRAINALSLLYIDPEESLNRETILAFHAHLVDAVLGPEPSAGADDRMLPAKKIITEQAVRFLDAWDGYLREHYYVAGIIPNDDLELVAYQAGHAMASLSWGVTTATAGLEDAAMNGQADDDAAKQFMTAWETSFREQDVIRLQHQISALSAALDDAYHERHGEPARPAAEAVPPQPSPDLPSEAIQAVKHSINYWQRTVMWIAERRKSPPPAGGAPDAEPAAAHDDLLLWKELRLALTEQANVWQLLMTGQQSLRTFNLEDVTRRIMKDVTDRIQSSLHRDFRDSLREADDAMKAVASEVKLVVRDAAEVAKTGLETLFLSSTSLLFPVFGMLALVGIVLVVITATGHASIDVCSVLGGSAGIVTAALGFLHLNIASTTKNQKISAIQLMSQDASNRVDNASRAAQSRSSTPSGVPGGGSQSGLLGRIEGAAGETESLVVSAFQKGYDQIRIELGSLSRSTAVAYPLVEFFASRFLKDEEEFLTKIIWNTADREEEIQRIISAAFGPLAIFMEPQGRAS